MKYAFLPKYKVTENSILRVYTITFKELVINRIVKLYTVFQASLSNN